MENTATIKKQITLEILYNGFIFLIYEFTGTWSLYLKILITSGTV